MNHKITKSLNHLTLNQILNKFIEGADIEVNAGCAEEVLLEVKNV